MTILTPAPTHMMRAACGDCAHEFDLCALPASMSGAARGLIACAGPRRPLNRIVWHITERGKSE